MAATVVSMALSLLGSAINKASSAATEEMSLLMNVRTEIWYIKDELKTMQAFLNACELMKKRDVLLKVWAGQVRDLAYDIEDCLDEFRVHLEQQSQLQQLKKLKHRHRIAITIRDLKSRAEDVGNRNRRYKLVHIMPDISTDKMDYTEDIRNLSVSNIDEGALLGLDGPKDKVLDLLDIDNIGPAKVVSVVGMGGLGKTTLAKKVSESNVILNRFTRHAWITVSQSFDRKELLVDMILKLMGHVSSDKYSKDLQRKQSSKELGSKQIEEIEHPRMLTKEQQVQMKRAELQNKQVDGLLSDLTQGLKEVRYFVVLDDLWKKDHWDWINRMAFPENNKGSQIIVTTRDAGLAEMCSSPQLVYHLGTLKDDDTKRLLLRKTNKTEADLEKDNNLNEIFNKILRKCGGLPLAIVTIGGVLATKHAHEWSKLYKELPSKLESDPCLGAIKNVVNLSYTHLPSHLKPCFLYLSIFPEDFEIQKSRLVNRWIAEGFIVPTAGMTIEAVGYSYFIELVNRSMIQPSKLNYDGTVRSCRVHDIMHDITVSISRDEAFTFFSMENDTSTPPENVRHLALQAKNSTLLDWNRVRSLTVFGKPIESLVLLRSSELRMLRVLDLEDAQITVTQQDINRIGCLCHLKYLFVNGLNSVIYNLPRSIGNLQGLQTLDIRNTFITKLPSEVTKLQCLSCLRCSHSGCYLEDLDLRDPKGCFITVSRLCFYDSEGVRVPKGIGKLKCLQILDLVNIKGSGLRIIKELGKLTQLRKLGLVGVSEMQGKELSAALDKLPYLRSLHLDSDSYDLRWLGSILILPLHLQSLKLGGHLSGLPSWVVTLTNLTKIYLTATGLVQDDLRVLGTLPNLVRLHLNIMAYIGEKLWFGRDAFPILRMLELSYLPEVRGVAFEEGASPKMERITIMCCEFTSGITGIRNLPNLQKISLDSEAMVAKLDRLQREMDAHPKHPVLTMKMSRSKHDLGDEEVSEAKEHSTWPPYHEVGQSSQSGAGPESMDNPTTKLKRSQSWTATNSYQSLEHQQSFSRTM
ncbi:hypothetical protein ABZP36_021043 [Zizania latifolia]